MTLPLVTPARHTIHVTHSAGSFTNVAHQPCSAQVATQMYMARLVEHYTISHLIVGLLLSITRLTR
jgi:hypothetical protein